MTDRDGGNDSLELEVYSDGQGVLRTEYGWFPVTGFSHRANIRFDVLLDHPVPPNPIDLEIIEKAATILSSKRAWDRADNRECPTDAVRWSIYCALEKAEIEVSGGFAHRRPAAEVVRTIIEQRTIKRNYPHRLMGYNNDSSTHLSDVQSLFQEAETSIRTSLKLQESPVVP